VFAVTRSGSADVTDEESRICRLDGPGTISTALSNGFISLMASEALFSSAIVSLVSNLPIHLTIPSAAAVGIVPLNSPLSYAGCTMYRRLCIFKGLFNTLPVLPPFLSLEQQRTK